LQRLIPIIAANRKLTVRVLLPYVLFLLMQCFLTFVICYLTMSELARQNHPMLRLIRASIIFFMLAVNAYQGSLIVKNAAKRKHILEAVTRIQEGIVVDNLNPEEYDPETKILVQSLNKIGEGIRKAIETSMKDERLKTELITNVSHDIKTPLTSIITYVGLIQQAQHFDEPVKGYLEVLESKAGRLKKLTDDLVEASKIMSGNISFEFEIFDLTQLVMQAIGEYTQIFEESELQLIFEEPEEAMYICADTSRMWRVLDNLLQNVTKYAMQKTRVYINIWKEKQSVILCIKNISTHPLALTQEDLTERFIRGDKSRSSEGSGLGLSIAKSLVQAQGGGFSLETDGDLFKAQIVFEEKAPTARDVAST
jgi:signal transduction histidine kinase